MNTSSRILTALVLLMTFIVNAPPAWAQDDDDDDGGSAWWLWAIIFGDASRLDFTLLGPQGVDDRDASCRGFSVKGTLISPSLGPTPALPNVATIVDTTSEVVFEQIVGPEQALVWGFETATERNMALKVSVMRLTASGQRLPVTPSCTPVMTGQTSGVNGEGAVLVHPNRAGGRDHTPRAVPPGRGRRE